MTAQLCAAVAPRGCPPTWRLFEVGAFAGAGGRDSARGGGAPAGDEPVEQALGALRAFGRPPRVGPQRRTLDAAQHGHPRRLVPDDAVLAGPAGSHGDECTYSQGEVTGGGRSASVVGRTANATVNTAATSQAATASTTQRTWRP
jgi:hypothetical protein